MATKNYTLLTLLDRNNGIADSNKFDISVIDYDDVNINDFPETDLHLLKYNNGEWTLEQIFDDQNLNNYVTDNELNQTITDLIGGAPSNLDSLLEISSKLNSDFTIIDDLTFKMQNNKQLILRGDDHSKIFHLPNHRAGYTSVNLNGVEQNNRINDSKILTDDNYFLNSQYDYYSGIGIVAYQAIEEFSIFGDGTELYKYENSIGYSFFGPGETWGIKRNHFGKQVEVGEIFTYGDNYDYIWTSGNNINGNYYYPTIQIEDVNPDFNVVLPNDSQEYFYYKIEKITAPNPLNAGETCNKIYFKNSPSYNSIIFIRMYF